MSKNAKAGDMIALGKNQIRHLVNRALTERTACGHLVIPSLDRRVDGPPTCLWCVAWARR